MPVYKKDGKYYARVNYVTPLGKYKSKQSKYFDTKREAEYAEHQLAMINDKGADVTFGFVYQEFLKYKKKMVSPQTFVTYETRWNYAKSLSNIPVGSLTARQYQEFKDSLDEYTYVVKKDNSVHHLSNKWKNDIHAFVKQLIGFADLMYGVDNKVPAKLGGFYSREVKEEMKVMSEDDFKKYIEQFKDDIVYGTFFRVLYYEGLRKGEANGLTWRCVDLKNKTIHVKQTVYLKLKDIPVMVNQPKTSKSDRILPMQKSVYDSLSALYEYYKKFPHFSEDWYVFGGFRPLSESSIDNKKNAACDAACVERIRIHDFRHSFASLLISKGTDVVQVSRALGHSNVAQTLNTYSHMFKNSLTDTFDKI